jgi:hypothetical protein
VLQSQEDIAAASVRVSEAEIYAFIEADCNEAMAKLPSTIPAEENGAFRNGLQLRYWRKLISIRRNGLQQNHV